MLELGTMVKTLIISFGIVCLMQVKVGNQTIEASVNHWVQFSGVGQFLQSVGTGAVVAGNEATAYIKYLISTRGNSNSSGQNNVSRERKNSEIDSDQDDRE